MDRPRLRVLDRRSHDVVAIPRSVIEELGMDLTSLGQETTTTVQQVWRTAATGDFGAMAQFLSRLDAKAHDAIGRGRHVSGVAADAPPIEVAAA